jgi:hypothetical protein
MRTSNLRKRIETLESRSQAKEELVPVSVQWLNEDGSPAGPRIERMVSEGCFEWLSVLPAIWRALRGRWSA